MATPEEIALLREYVGAHSDVSDATLEGNWDRANARLVKICGDQIGEVPPAEFAGMVKEVAGRMYFRKNAPLGISQFADGNSNPMRVPADDLAGIYPTLRQYLGLGIG